MRLLPKFPWIAGVLPGLMALLASSPAAAMSEAYCAFYGADAVRQSKEYFDYQCSGGLGEWWNPKPDYHADWCETLPEGSPLPAKGIADREGVLAMCRLERGTAGTLVVHNNTDATLELYVTYDFAPQLATLPVHVAPVSRATLVIYFGNSELTATAINVNGQPTITMPASVYKREGREIELFAQDFGASFLTD